jgi:N-acyl-L-homoserine lactone synthetase
MIRLIQGANAAAHPKEIDSMFRARAAVFHDRLGWSVSVQNSLEIDKYDALNPLYLVCIDDQGIPKGSLRLLPTTGPNMLGECFGSYFDDSVDLSSSTIWECTRFCIHPNTRKEVSATGAMRTTWELMLGICEVGLLAGLTQIQGVYGESMIGVYRRTRWSPVPIARTERLGPLPVYVGLWDVNEEILNRMRRVSGITSSVIGPEEARHLNEVA